jgi:CAAX prenyl protease-like protein
MSGPAASISRSLPRRSPFGDDWSYLLPMITFIGFTQISGWWPDLFPAVYVVKTIATALLLVLCWPAFTRISWKGWRLGIIVGIVGVVQWVAMEKLLLRLWPNYPRMHATTLDPFSEIENPTVRFVFLAFRWLGPTLVVPVMEELFWRDYLWRTLIAPNDFKLAQVGEWDSRAFWLVPLFFATVHMQIWITAVVWAVMIGLLLLKTRSIGSCIIAHGVTNFLLGAYVLFWPLLFKTPHDWYFW